MEEFKKAQMMAEARKVLQKEGPELMLELGKEFGERLAYATQNGIPREVAFECCRDHFRKVGSAMVELADLISFRNCFKTQMTDCPACKIGMEHSETECLKPRRPSEEEELKEARRVIEYCSSYSNTKKNENIASFMTPNGEPDMTLAMSHAISCFENMAREFLAKFPKDIK